MLPDNYRAISLTKKMGFDLEYLSDSTVKGSLDLTKELANDICINLPEPPKTEVKAEAMASPKTESKTETKTDTKASSKKEDSKKKEEAISQVVCVTEKKDAKPETASS